MQHGVHDAAEPKSSQNVQHGVHDAVEPESSQNVQHGVHGAVEPELTDPKGQRDRESNDSTPTPPVARCNARERALRFVFSLAPCNQVGPPELARCAS